MAAPGASAIAGLDHALVGVRDLEAARASWGKLGLKITPRGRHIGWGTANYCIMFERGYTLSSSNRASPPRQRVISRG